MDFNFNKEMARKSMSITEKNKNIEEAILNKVNKGEYDSPEDKAKAIMKAFYEEDKIRPEILLVASEFSSKLLTDISEIDSFEEMLRKYQILEQKALNPENDTFEGLYPDNFAMKMSPDEIENFVEEEKELNNDQSNDDISFGTDSVEPTPELIEPGLIGVTPISNDVSLDTRENYINKRIKAQESGLEEQDPELEEHELEGLTRAQYLEKKLKEYLASYEIEDSNMRSFASKALGKQESFYYRDGKTKMHVFQKDNAESPYHINLGREPDKKDLVAGLLLVQPKNISNFPLRIKGGRKDMLAVLEESLREIKEQDLFDLNELTVSKGVDKKVLKLIEKIKNEESFTLGVQKQKPKRVRRESPNDEDPEIENNEGTEPSSEVENNEGTEPNSEVENNEGTEPSSEVENNEGTEPNSEVENNDFEQDSFSITDDELNPTDKFDLEEEEERLSKDISEEIGVFNQNMDNQEDYPRHEENSNDFKSNDFDPNEYDNFIQSQEEQFFEMPENFNFDELSSTPPEENKPTEKEKKKKQNRPKR